MRKYLLTAVAAATMSLISHAAVADQLDDIKKKGTLVCGVLGTSEPFSFPNPQTREIQGYDVDFCAAIAKSLGVKLEIKPVAVAARIPELVQGRIDVIAANLGWTPERAEQIVYSDSYYAALQKAASKKSSNFKSADDLAGKRISSTKGSTSEAAIKTKYPTATSVTFQDPPTAFLAMQQGKADAFVVSEMMLLKLKQQSEATQPIVILEPQLADEKWGIGMRKGETALINHVNATLQKMEASQEATNLFNKWMGDQTEFKMKRGFKIEPIKG